MSVLIVDDEYDIRQAVTEVLAEEGYEVISASDGAEALAQLRAHHPNLVLLDLMMPGMNGWEFREEQQHDPEVADIPVIILSALGKVPSIDADGFLPKPFDLEDLLSNVRRFADASSQGPRPGDSMDSDAHAP